MKLNRLSLQSPSKTSETLTLIHGWGAQNSVWMDWVEEDLLPHINVDLIELPGFGKSPDIAPKPDISQIESKWVESLILALPEKTHLAGWSLGGLLCQSIATQAPEKVQSLTCIASTPRFTQLEGWKTAVSPELLLDFIKALGIEYGSVLKQFWRLQLQGSDNARPLMKKLQKHMTDRSIPTYTGLLHGLYLLRDMDNRETLTQLTQPTLWLLGENDPLIPITLAEEAVKLQPSARIEVIQGASHMPFFSHPKRSAQTLIDFIRSH